MNEAVNEYEYFASRQGFNNAAGHFDAVKELLSDLGACRNLAGELNLRLNDKTLTQRQLSALVNALLVDKFQYKTYSHNLEENMEPAQDASEVFLPWKAVDLVFVYHHPDLGYMVLDPKNKKHWELVTLFKKNELLTIYVGEFAKTKPDNPLYDLAIDQAIAFFNGKKIKTPAALAKGSFKFIDTAPAPKAPPRRKAAGPVRRRKGEAPPVSPPAETPKAALQSVSAISAAPVAAPAPSEGDKSKRRMTPFYGIPVTNELFHNGNVEAWKKVIMSYETKHPGLEVYIYYDGERIHDIHTLFKWGKVKHGSTILFTVCGEDIQDVAKLQRYLKQGASSRFEDFLRFPVNQILNLF